MLIIFSWCIGDVKEFKYNAVLVCLVYGVVIPLLLGTFFKLFFGCVVFFYICTLYLRKPMLLVHFIIDEMTESIRISKSWPEAHCKCNWSNCDCQFYFCGWFCGYIKYDNIKNLNWLLRCSTVGGVKEIK